MAGCATAMYVCLVKLSHDLVESSSEHKIPDFKAVGH